MTARKASASTRKAAPEQSVSEKPAVSRTVRKKADVNRTASDGAASARAVSGAVASGRSAAGRRKKVIQAKRHICIRTCFWQSRVWSVGEVMEASGEVPRHFERLTPDQ
ncbi:hypothetical protein [Kiloniella sp. b19]|uniref:hypothetical protein n=1 Tax=Kiloniella sp. GXU_MW_B19 TaxID=3141326 RepID=UPI0031DDD000